MSRANPVVRDFEIWKLDSSRGYKITFYEAWHHRIVSKVPTLWRSHMLNSSPGRWQQNLRIKTDLPPDLHSPDKQLSVAALLVQALTRKVTCRKYKISHNVKGYPRYIYFYTQQFVEKKRWNKSIRGGLPGGWRPGEVVTRPNCRGPHMARQLPAVRGDGSGAERSAARVVDPLLTPAVFTSPGTADTRVSQLFHWWISLSVQTSVI